MTKSWGRRSAADVEGVPSAQTIAPRGDQSVRAVYNRSLRLEERRKMMQAWADYLTGLRAGTGNIIPLKRIA